MVSAASIIAKVERDRAIEKLKEKYRNISEMGSGYTSDPKTMKFLEKWYVQFRSYPECVRKSWKPAKELKKNVDGGQRKLTQF